MIDHLGQNTGYYLTDPIRMVKKVVVDSAGNQMCVQSESRGIGSIQ